MANLKDLIVNGKARSVGGFIGDLDGTADKATNDVDGNPIKTTYLKVADKPVVNNATLTIQKNSTNVATFTANASSNVTANITVPTKLSEFTDDLGTSPTHTHSQYSTTANTVSAVVAGTTADKINVTKNGSTSTITVNNVANATNATKATQDANGNVITSTYATVASLATVATSGSYNDLTNKPTIPTGIEWATYGTTTYDEIRAWFDAGKQVFVKRNLNDASGYEHWVVYALVYVVETWVKECVFRSEPEYGADSTDFIVYECKATRASSSSDTTWREATHYYQGRIPAGTAGQAVTYTGIAGEVGSAVIPVVNDATLTIQADGNSKGTFTANASSNATINIQKSDFYPTKTYTGLIGTTNAWKNACFYLMTLRPNTWDGEWAVKYKVESSLDEGLTPSNYKMFTSQHECYLTGRQGVYTAYANFNSFSSTSYRPLYYFTNHKTTEAGYTAGYGHKLGINLTSSNSNLDVNYKRTFKITILDTSNCTVTFNDAPEIAPNSDRTDYTKLNSTYYTTSDSNSAGNFSNLNGCDNGLQESGDANTTDVTNLDNYYLVNGSKNDTTSLRIFGYNLIGFGRDGKALCISVPTAATTANTTAIQTARVYNTEGFEPSKGLLYTNSATVFGADANINITPRRFTSSVDMRYSDNCVAASTANDLGFVLRKPIYLRGTIGADGLFYVAPMEVTYNSATYKRAWIQDLPNTEDGYVYWFVGYPYYNSSYPNSLYQFVLNAANHVIHYKNGKYQTYVPASNTTGTFTSSNWTLSSGKYTYTIPVTTTTETVHVDVFDGNGVQVQPEDVTIIKTNGNITSVKLTINAIPDCRFAGSYTLQY